MASNNPSYVNILEAFLQLPFEERLSVLQQLISSLKQQPQKEPNQGSSLLDLAGTANGIYGDIDDYIENERNWD